MPHSTRTPHRARAGDAAEQAGRDAEAQARQFAAVAGAGVPPTDMILQSPCLHRLCRRGDDGCAGGRAAQDGLAWRCHARLHHCARRWSRCATCCSGIIRCGWVKSPYLLLLTGGAALLTIGLARVVHRFHAAVSGARCHRPRGVHHHGLQYRARPWINRC